MDQIIMRGFRYLAIVFCCLFGLASIVATGGGGGGGGGGIVAPPGIQYLGLTTQATVTSINAEDLALGAYTGGKIGTAGSLGTLTEEETLGLPRILKLSRVLEYAIENIDRTWKVAPTGRGAIVTETGTIQGTCGGSASYSIAVDNVTGDFSGTLAFYSYCDEAVVLSSEPTSFYGKIDLNPPNNILQFTLGFTRLDVVSGSDSFAAKGNILFNFQGLPSTAFLEMLMQDKSTGRVYWVNNYQMDVEVWAGYASFEVFGRYYDPRYGYVEISTSTPFHIYDGEIWPRQGMLGVAGAGGTAASLGAHYSGPPPTFWYEIEADTDGDAIDDWFSGQRSWH